MQPTIYGTFVRSGVIGLTLLVPAVVLWPGVPVVMFLFDWQPPLPAVLAIPAAATLAMLARLRVLRLPSESVEPLPHALARAGSTAVLLLTVFSTLPLVRAVPLIPLWCLGCVVAADAWNLTIRRQQPSV